jgi:ribosomal-protein-alanine N-acetyltransferase
MIGWLSRMFKPASMSIEPAAMRDAPRLSELHRASFHRGWGKGEFEDMLAASSVLAHRLLSGRQVVGFIISRIAADEAEILSVAIASNQRGRGLSRNLVGQHLGYLLGHGVQRVFLEVEENNMPAVKLYQRAGFRVVGKREQYYSDASGAKLNALVMQRDLS